jgi:peptide/nickel transport system permease protein
MMNQSRRSPILRVFTVGFLILVDALAATFVINGMTSLVQTALYFLANVFFIIWLVIVWRNKTAMAIGVLVTMLMVIGAALGVDYFTTEITALSELEFFITLGLRVSLGALTAVSALLIIRKMSTQHRRVQRFLWILFSVGMGLYVSTFSAISGVEVFLPLGLTLLVFGTIFQRRKRIGQALILAIWVFILVEMIGVYISTSLPDPSISFPVLSTSLKESIASLPLYIYALLYLPALYFFLPGIWKSLLGNRDRIANGWKLFSESMMGKIGFSIVLVLVLMGVFAPYLAPYPYHELNVKEMTLPPSWEHPLGTNHYGEDLLSRVIWGSRVSLLVGFTAATLSVIIGTLIGMVGGYYGGVPDSILMRITDLFLSVPTLPLMLIFAALFGKGLPNIILVLSILGWTGTARMVRSETLSLKERPLTEAAKAIGATDTRILGHHVLPNVLPLILASMVLSIVNAILGEAWVSFLGFGVSLEEPPSWGIILYWADLKLAVINNYWWWIVPPGLLLMLLVLGFAFMSHALDQVLNPRLRRRRR